MPNGKLGRPTLLTPERFERIIELIRGGAFMETAAKASGVSVPTLYAWLARGRGEVKDRAATPLYEDFVEAVEQARAEAEARHVLNISRHSINDWRASQAFLKMCYPNRYGDRVEVTGPNGGPIQVEKHTIETLLMDPARSEAVADAGIDATLESMNGDG